MTTARTILHLCLALLGFAAVTGCRSVGPVESHDPSEPVRKVDFGGIPELKEMARHAREFGNEMYPKIQDLFADGLAKPPARFNVELKPLKSGRIGESFVELRRIRMNSSCLTNDPNWKEVFDKVFVHEMTHLALGHKAFRWSRPDYGWEEGLSDYAFYKLVGTNGWGSPQCDYCFPHYDSGYTCAGAFLLHVESKFGTNVIRRLSAVLRQHHYTDAFFLEATGKSLEELWTEFQTTSAFKPGAVEAFALWRELGFLDGEPPKNAITRFNRYLDRHADEFTRNAVKSSNVAGARTRDVRTLITVYLYFMQPGGSAEKAWVDLRESGGVPGIIKGEKGFLSASFKSEEILSQNYPQSRTLDVHKRGDDSIYHYTMTRASRETGWVLGKAWRTSPDGQIVETFSVP